MSCMACRNVAKDMNRHLWLGMQLRPSKAQAHISRTHSRLGLVDLALGPWLLKKGLGT